MNGLFTRVYFALACLNRASFRFLTFRAMAVRVSILRLIPPKSQQWTTAEAPHNSFSCGSHAHTQQCLSWTQKRHLDYIIILQVRWYSYIYLRNGLLYRHRHRHRHRSSTKLMMAMTTSTTKMTVCCNAFSSMHNNHNIIFTATALTLTAHRYTNTVCVVCGKYNGRR